MSTPQSNGVVGLDRFNTLLGTVVSQIDSDEFQPDTILALSIGGFPVAAALAKQLGIQSHDVAGLSVQKDERGRYHLSEQIVKLGDFVGRQVLVVDEASNSGVLTTKVVTEVEDRGGVAKSCVLIASTSGIQPDFVGENCDGKPPKFYWEVPSR